MTKLDYQVLLAVDDECRTIEEIVDLFERYELEWTFGEVDLAVQRLSACKCGGVVALLQEGLDGLCVTNEGKSAILFSMRCDGSFLFSSR